MFLRSSSSSISPDSGVSPRLGLIVAVAIIVQSLPSAAFADECASYGPEAFLGLPLAQSSTATPIARNAFFEIDVAPRCGAIEGPAPVFRLVDAQGEVVASTMKTVSENDACRPTACSVIHLKPDEMLAPGIVVVEQRTAVDATSRGSWSELGRFEVVDRIDDDTPVLTDPLEVEVAAVEGSVAISPCESEPAWELELTFVFPPATDSAPADELVYSLQRAPVDGGAWTTVREFRPDSRDDDRVQTVLRSQDFGETARYRLGVRDAAGHETWGEPVEITHPARPSGLFDILLDR